jgi:hypothetical protein
MVERVGAAECLRPGPDWLAAEAKSGAVLDSMGRGPATPQQILHVGVVATHVTASTKADFERNGRVKQACGREVFHDPANCSTA